MDNVQEIVEWFGRDQSLPPSFQGDTFSYAMSVTGLMIVFLLSAEWLWRVLWSMRESPRELRHPITISRTVLALLLASVLMRVTCDVVLTLAWPELSAEQRLSWAWTDRLMDGLSAGPTALAWLVAVLGGPMVDWQLMRRPVPINLWPSWRQVRRPALIAAWVVGIAFTVAYLR